LLEASKAQNSINVQLDRARTSRINRSRVRRRDRRHQLASLPLDFLAIGDSWFEYPIYDNGPIPGETGIVAQTQLGSIGNPPPSILNQALHGQTRPLGWANEIHPYFAGFTALAEKFLLTLRNKFAGRI
jgi:hypothetical protein